METNDIQFRLKRNENVENFQSLFYQVLNKNRKTSEQREELKKTAFMGDACLDSETGDLYVFDGIDFIKYDPNNQSTYNIEKIQG